MKLSNLKDKLENYWYLYKFRTIVIFFVIMTIIFASVQSMSTVTPDYSIILNISEAVPTEFTTALSNEIKKSATDLNKDGKVEIYIINCSYSSSNSKAFTDNQKLKLNAELLSKKAYMIITDDARFSEFENKLLIPLDFAKDKNGKAFCTTGTKIEKALKDAKFKTSPYYVSIRNVDSSNKKAVQAQTDAINLLKKTITNSK